MFVESKSAPAIMSIPTTEELKALGQSYHFFLEMQKLSRSAAQGSKEASRILENMLQECKSAESWARHNYWCSAVIRCAVSAETDQSLAAVIAYVNELQDELPYGAVELISSLLPIYGERIIPELRKWYDGPQAGPSREIAVQTLCNLYMEDRLGDKNQEFFRNVLENYKSAHYLTQHLMDLAQNRMSGSNNISGEVDMEEFLKDVIVERG